MIKTAGSDEAEMIKFFRNANPCLVRMMQQRIELRARSRLWIKDFRWPKLKLASA